MVLACMFTAMILHALIFREGYEAEVKVHFLHINTQLTQHHLLKYILPPSRIVVKHLL